MVQVAGRLIDERFRVLYAAAQGGMAQVFRAEIAQGPERGRAVAIKRILPELEGDALVRSMFDDESRIASFFRHPNIVRCEHSGLDHEGPYLALEWIDGLSWRELLSRAQGPLPARVVVSIAADVLRALGALHAHREVGTDGRERRVTVIHRDVSPSNVLVARSGIAKLADFGLARAIDRPRTTPRGTVTGKLSYLPPEALTQKPFGVRGDLYSLGVCVWEALTGRKLFAGVTSDGELLGKILRAERPTLRQCAPGLDRDLCDLVDRSVAHDPSLRPASADAFAEQLIECARESGDWVGRYCVGEYVASIEHRIGWDGDHDAPTNAGRPTSMPPKTS